MIIHSLRSSLCDKVTYSHQSKKKKGDLPTIHRSKPSMVHSLKNIGVCPS